MCRLLNIVSYRFERVLTRTVWNREANGQVGSVRCHSTSHQRRDKRGRKGGAISPAVHLPAWKHVSLPVWKNRWTGAAAQSQGGQYSHYYAIYSMHDVHCEAVLCCDLSFYTLFLLQLSEWGTVRRALLSLKAKSLNLLTYFIIIIIIIIKCTFI